MENKPKEVSKTKSNNTSQAIDLWNLRVQKSREQPQETNSKPCEHCNCHRKDNK